MSEMPGTEPEISRVIRSKQEAQAMYDQISRWYDLLVGMWERKPRRVGLRELDAREGETVLEIGFGPGHGLMALAQAVGDPGRVYGIDLSPRMNEIARARVDQAGLSERVDVLCGDALHLPFEPERFDAIFLGFTLELFDTPEIPGVLRECRRVLRHGGRICVVCLSKAGGPSKMREIYEWGHATFPRLLDCRPISAQRSLEEAGFQVLDAIRMSLWGLPLEVILVGRL
jgi:ubiquinone/menaquinone biosynthesis C-methylase UbiE